MKYLLCCIILSVTVCRSVAQSPIPEELDSLIERAMTTFEVPGIAVAIVKDGRVIHSKGYGVRSLISKEKTDENTLFGIASNTKAFTTTALGILVDQKKLSWDDKVVKYIPEFKMYSPWVTQEFTIRDLLTHRSGLGLGAGDLMFYPDSSDFTVKDVIHNLRYLKPVSLFRTKYDYDNTLYIVAGEVIKRVSGRNWDSFVEDNILAPLGMQKSAASYSRLKDKNNVSDPHVNVEGVVKVVRRHYSNYSRASGSLYSSVGDLARWMIFHLSFTANDQKQHPGILSRKVHDDLLTPQTIIPVRSPGFYNTHFSAYGLGFNISDVKGYKQLSHTGATVGMYTQVTMIPELQLGIVVLTNQQVGSAFSAITDQIKDFYFGIAGTDRVSEYSSGKSNATTTDEYAESAWKQVASQQDISKKVKLVLYAGQYQDKWLGAVTIFVKEGKLWFASKRSPKLTGKLFYYKPGKFVVSWLDRSMGADAFVNFKSGAAGNITGFTMGAISPFTDFSYDFHDLDFRKL